MGKGKAYVTVLVSNHFLLQLKPFSQFSQLETINSLIDIVLK